MLAQERRQRLVTAMREAGIGHLVLYGNAWQGDYLRYGADFGILEGRGIALVSADGEVELFLDSATDAERAEVEVPLIRVHLAPDIARAVGARLDRVANDRIAARAAAISAALAQRQGASFYAERRNGAARQSAHAQDRRRSRRGASRRAIG